MATHNGAAFLQAQLDSLVAQTSRPSELVVQDDASTDTTPAILEAFAVAAPFPVRIGRNEHRLGATATFEQAIARCSGSFIALCDQDDVWRPHKLARLLAAMSSREGAGIAFSDAQVVDDHLRPLGYGLWAGIGYVSERREHVEAGHAFEELLAKNFVPGTTTLFRAELVELLLPIPREFRHDAWIALLAVATSVIVPVPEQLIDYRQHAAQLVGADRRRVTPQLHRFVRNHTPKALLARMSSTDPFVHEQARLEALASRLTLAGARLRSPSTLVLVEDRLAHCRTRATLPRRPSPRARVVMAEARTSRYRRYSCGVRSTLADLLLPPPRR